MNKPGFDQERIKRHFEGKNDDPKYLYRLFGDDQYSDELEHSFRLKWYELLNEDDKPVRNLDHILYKINYMINQKEAAKSSRTLRLFTWYSRIAAILILPLLIYTSLHIFDPGMKKEHAWVEIKAPAWGRVQFHLPDGSKGWLNSKSSLKYYENFTVMRKVVLNGEAYFDVASDSRHPFKVNTAEVTVNVLGTKFNIESYRDENTIEVTLEEGKLEYYNKRTSRSYSMNPNDHVHYDRLSGDCKIEKVQPEKYTAWKDGKLIFRNDPLDMVVRRLERWYNVDIEITGDISNRPRLRATFVDEDLEHVLELLKRSLPIDFKIIEHGKTCGTYLKTKVIISTRSR